MEARGGARGAVAGGCPTPSPSGGAVLPLARRPVDPRAGLAASGAQTTLTAFALQVPHRLGVDRAAAEAAVLASLEDVLAEPVEPLLLRDRDGRPCIETRTTSDLEEELRLPGGNIFHAPLAFPFRSASGAEGEWGVRTADERILLCGSGTTRAAGCPASAVTRRRRRCSPSGRGSAPSPPSPPSSCTADR